jgi:hypothetical protein
MHERAQPMQFDLTEAICRKARVLRKVVRKVMR